ncbi:MAG: Asp-tRNA(Asn)/Glu-tRNA(Gln) amidotransferase subunit GatC [Ignavibacteria bacterium]|nr:Asp-tRNA(Asn)/Glu-tRNA(Gln) amidotransferase subunit GatC [Ignavibacteria bacterium]
MSVSKEEVIKIAKLAKLKFSDEGISKLQKEMNRILEYIDTLNEIPELDKVEPLYSVNSSENVFRKDEPKQSISKEEALKNAPDKTENFFRVPKVIDK